MHYSLLYISRTTCTTSEDVLDSIREQSSALNLAAGITGLLLWSDTHFCQILQGPKDAVLQTMDRINKDQRHHEPLVILRTELAEALFPDWSMASSKVGNADIARQIAIAYEDRLADLSLVDGIIELMQQFRLQSRFCTPSVIDRSMLDQRKAALELDDLSDQAVEHLLQLGCSIFPGHALMLVLQAGFNGKPYLKACAGLNNSQASQIVQLLFDETSGNVRGDGVIATEGPHRKYFQASLPCSSGYSSASGCVIDSTRLAIPGAPQTEPSGTDSHRSQTGTLWLLGSEPLMHSANGEFSNLAACIESTLEQRIRSFSTELLQQESRRHQLSMAASKRRQEMVMDVASSAIVALDRTCRVLMINNTAREMFGQMAMPVPYPWPASIQFRDPWALEPLPDPQCPIHLAANSGAGHTFDPEAVTPGGSIVALQITEAAPLRYLKVTVSHINDTDSAICGVVVFDDVTELQHNRDRIRRSDRLEALGHLTGGIAHDFNNLLSTIQSSVELASVETNNQSRQSFLDIALDSVQRGADLTDKLVTFAVGRSVSTQVHQLSDIMRSVADLAKASIEQDVKFLLGKVPHSLSENCDAGQLENALLNILINSRDAIIDSGTGDQVSIEVRLSNPGSNPGTHTTPGIVNTLDQKSIDIENTNTEKIQIRITDNGPGMSAEVIRRATDPFFSTKSSNSGSGLGLSMVYRFIQQSEGELLIENLADSQPGSTGTRVTLQLDQALPEAAQTAQTRLEPEPFQQGATVLVVEDEVNLATMLAQSLERFGLSVRVAHNADAALKTLHADNDIDLLLTDIIMPDSEFDGYALAAEATRIKAGLKVVYLSGYSQPADTNQVSLLGPLLGKPVSMHKLAGVIHQQLAKDADLQLQV